MLIKANWDEINFNDNSTVDRVGLYRIADEIEKVIKDNINIQFALAQTYLYKDYKDYISYQTTLDFLSEKDEVSQINNFKLIFSQIQFLKLNGKTNICNVGTPITEALNVFEKLISQNKLNPLLKYFMLRGSIKNDCHNPGLYRLLLTHKQDDDLVFENIKENPFINYILFSKRNLLEVKGFQVSGFTMDELELDKNIRTLARCTNNLYIIVSETELDDKIFFTKYLTWID